MSDPGRRMPARLRGTIVVACLAAVLAADAAAEPPPPDGAAVFKARCARCHGESGKTDTPSGRVLKVRPLVDDPKLAGMAPADIVNMIKADAKHQAVGALNDVDDAELRAVAVFVKELAAGR